MAVEWVRLQLDLEKFDDAQFVSYLRRCQQSGIDFTTMADIGDAAENRRALYELNKTCSADIPGRGEFYTFDEYLAQRIETPAYDPRGIVLAVSNGVWVGMAATSLQNAKGYAFSEMTGVLPGHRGQGISLAMKLLAIGYARSRDMLAPGLPPPGQRNRHQHEPATGVHRRPATLISLR
jgi:hypothetical protein